MMTIREYKRVESLEEALARFRAVDSPLLLQGEILSLFKEEVTAAGLSSAPPHAAMPRAGSVAVLGARMLAQGISHSPMDLEPVYIRRSEAEELWEKRHPARTVE